MSLDTSRFAAISAGFCAFLQLYAPQTVLPHLAETANISPAQAGAVIGASTLAVAISAPFVGLLADRVGNKPTMVGAILLMTLPTIMLIFAGSFGEMVVWRFVQGLCLPAVFSSAVAHINEEWSPRDAADVMGQYMAGCALGGFTGRMVTALMAENFGWRAGFAVLLVISLLCCAAIWKWLPSGKAKVKATAETSPVRVVFDHLRNPVLLATFAAGFAVLFSLVATFTYVNFHLSRAPFSLGPAALGMMFAVYLFGAIIAPYSGAMIRRVGRRPAIAFSTGLGCFGLMITLVPTLSAVLVGLALFVAGIFLTQACAMGFVAQAARTSKSTAVGLYTCLYYIGGSVGAVVPGWVWVHAGWSGCVALLVATMGSAGVLAYFGWKPEARLCAAE